MGGVDNISTTVKIKIHYDHLHQEESILTRKAAVTSTFNTLNKIIIARYVYEKYISNFYDDRHVDLYNLECKTFFKQCLDELEHAALVTYWTSNIEKSSDEK